MAAPAPLNDTDRAAGPAVTGEVMSGGGHVPAR